MPAVLARANYVVIDMFIVGVIQIKVVCQTARTSTDLLHVRTPSNSRALPKSGV